MLSEAQAEFVQRQRVAHLATADAAGQPHVVPVCFVYHLGAFWIAIDEKPKRSLRLKRLRNIAENPHVSLVFDRYEEDWSRLGYVLVLGKASVVPRGEGQPGVLAALRTKYPQYAGMALEERPLIRVTPERAVSWGAPGWV
ncbi:MAG: TIGR03668 family PPOX class F420-dependent oxidoreductase [Dehalococcoidia bacterium]|nr:TIGR03668 family PPOX class F420-dependent oxidoreductase [Dehalococcoidia bacterium]